MMAESSSNVQQSSELLTELVSHSNWQDAVHLIGLPVSNDALRFALNQAIAQRQLIFIQTVIEKVGTMLEEVCELALKSLDYELMLMLGKRVIPTILRDRFLQSALADHHVACTVGLLEFTVSKHVRDLGLQHEITAGHCQFIGEVVRTVRDPDLTAFVLQESARQGQRLLVTELLKEEGMCEGQKGVVLDIAASSQQWALVSQLLQDGVTPSKQAILHLFDNNMEQGLLDLYPPGSMSDSMKENLLIYCIWYGRTDLAARLTQQERISGAGLMEAFKYSVRLLKEDALLELIKASPRHRRIFKQQFLNQCWRKKRQYIELEDSDGLGRDEMHWLYDKLYAAGEQDLAQYVAITLGNIKAWDFCDVDDFDCRKVKCLYALRKLHENSPHEYRVFVMDLYRKRKSAKFDRSFLFCQAIHFAEYSLAVDLCKYGVSRKDLKFALAWHFRCQEGHVFFTKIRRQLDGRKCIWLKQFALRFTMREYFRQQTDKNLRNFIYLFKICNDQIVTNALFRKAIPKCVELDCADCFVKLCEVQFPVYNLPQLSHSELDDCTFAFNSVVTGSQPNFLLKVCKLQIQKNWDFLSLEVQFIADLVIEKEAWSFLPSLIEVLNMPMFELLRNGVGFKILKKCILKMLSDPAKWPALASYLNQWIRENFEPSMVVPMLESAQTDGAWPGCPEWSSLKQWCVKTGYANLAFLLALVTKDWDFVEMLARTQTLLNPYPMLLRVVEFAAENGAFSAGAAMLKLLPFDTYTVSTFQPKCGSYGLTRACEAEGLVDWALVLQSYNWKYVMVNHSRCQNGVVLNCLLQRAVDNSEQDVAAELISRCTNRETLEGVLLRTVHYCEVNIIEALSLFERVDPTTISDHVLKRWHGTVLNQALTGNASFEAKMATVRLLIAKGLSTFQRGQHEYRYNCPLEWAFNHGDLGLIKLLLASGACSNKAVHTFRRQHYFQYSVRDRDMAGEKMVCYRYICEVCSTPSRLLHMARLAVSHAIGCRPGRSERIQALPIPRVLKDMLKFEDVLSTKAE